MTSMLDEHLNAVLAKERTPPDKPAGWVPIRTLEQHHRARVLGHLLELGERDRYLRFGHAASDDQIKHYVNRIDFERDEVFGIFDAKLALVGMAHLAFANSQDMAEFGVSVHPHLRGRGLGGRLFHHAVIHARNRGAQTMAIHIARENKAMLKIVSTAGAQISYDGSDATAQLELPPQTLGTTVEALIESQAANWDYRIKLQVLRLDQLREEWLGSGDRPS